MVEHGLSNTRFRLKDHQCDNHYEGFLWVDAEVTKMLEQGVVKPSSSPWSSPIVMVKKKDGSWRFCVDYRKLNSVTRQDAYPLPRIDATIDSLAGATYFTTLDLASGYWQVEVEEQDKKKNRFFDS